MQDFEVKVASGATIARWLDPERPAGTLGLDDPGRPSRLNPLPGAPHLRWSVPIDTMLELHCWVGGVDAPPDGALGGRLFEAWVVESADPILRAIVRPQSSIVQFTNHLEGHYAIGVRRQSGGAVIFHFDVPL